MLQSLTSHDGNSCPHQQLLVVVVVVVAKHRYAIRTDCSLNRTRNMRLLRELSERRFFLLHLLIVGVARADGIKVSDVTDDKTMRDVSLRSQHAVRETTTTTTSQPAAGERKLMSPIVMKNLSRNASSGIFRPSVHLGEIEQPSTVIRISPFNSVQHVKFDNNVQLDTRREHLQDVLQDTYQGVSSILDEATRPSRIKFQDDGKCMFRNEKKGMC